MFDCNFWFRYARFTLYIRSFIFFFHFLNSAIHCDQTARGCDSPLIFLARARHFASQLSFPPKTNHPRRFPLRPYFHGRRRVAHRLASFLREKTDFQERYLWHSRNEMHAASRRRERDRSRGHRIVNWLSMRLLRCAAPKQEFEKRKVLATRTCTACSDTSGKLFLKSFLVAVFYCISVCAGRSPTLTILILPAYKEGWRCILQFILISFRMRVLDFNDLTPISWRDNKKPIRIIRIE